MNRTFLNKSLIIPSIIGIAALTSCEPDDVCLPEQAPFITVEMKYPDETTLLKDTVYYKAYANDTILIGDGNVMDKSTFNLPIITTPNKTIKYVLEQGKTYSFHQINGNDTVLITRKAPKDSIYVTYSIDNQYDSKACGFGIIFKDAEFKGSNTWIKKYNVTNTTINDATTTNLIIIADRRSNQ